MKNLIFLCTVGCLLLIAGCATTFVPPSKAEKAGADRIYAPQSMLHPFKDCAVLYVTRGNGTMDAAGVRIGFDIDNQKAASIWPGEKVEFFLEPGQHLVSFDHPGVRGSQAIYLRKGATTIISIALGFMGSGGARLLIKNLNAKTPTTQCTKYLDNG